MNAIHFNRGLAVLAFIAAHTLAWLPIETHADSLVSAHNWTDRSAWTELMQWFDSQTNLNTSGRLDHRQQNFFGVEKDASGKNPQKPCQLYLGASSLITNSKGVESQSFTVKWLDGSHARFEQRKALQYTDFATEKGDLDSTKVLYYSSEPLSDQQQLIGSGEFQVQPGRIRISGPGVVVSVDFIKMPPDKITLEIATDTAGNPIWASLKYDDLKEPKICHFENFVALNSRVFN